MADSTILNLDLQTTGSNAGTWGTVTNENLEKLEKAVKGYISVAITTTPQALAVSSGTDGTSDAQSRAAIKFTGTLGANSTVTCEANGYWFIIDDQTNRTGSDFTLTFKPSGGTGVTLVNGAKHLVYTDGSTMFDVLADAGTVGVTGALTTASTVSMDTGTFTFNTSEGDYDARFAGNSETNLLFIDAGEDRVGINTNAPGKDLDVVGTFRASGNTDIDGGNFTFNDSAASKDARFEGLTQTHLLFVDGSADFVGIKTDAPTHALHVAGTVKATGAVDLDGGAFVWNETGAALDLRMETGGSDAQANMFFVDGSEDKIGMGTDSPANARVEINQSNTTGAMACLSLKQDDNDQPFMFFEGDEQSDTSGNITTGSVGSISRYVRVRIDSTDYWMPIYDTS